MIYHNDCGVFKYNGSDAASYDEGELVRNEAHEWTFDICYYELVGLRIAMPPRIC